eukprot:TRINITY_DN3297_c0_g2_i1.p1 TRINITY_DN3297_c0_g2~~TRINITY_DN3297_c0_g2_i1.p1  ORF type:complete len:224 (+),score=17.62 TRINITY_DN3297_c0_g2_i1:101-772(+)
MHNLPGIEAVDKQTRREIVPNKCWVIENLLTSKECNELIAVAENKGFELIAGVKNYRFCERLVIEDTQLISWLWERLRPHVPQFLRMAEETEEDEDSPGEIYHWSVSGLHPYLRACKYSPGHHFNTHYDYPVHPGPLKQSFFTFMLYLNEDFEGGRTLYMKQNPKDEIDFSVVPMTGLAIVFLQGDYGRLLHKGEIVKKGIKYILRTEVLYDRLEKVINVNNE